MAGWRTKLVSKKAQTAALEALRVGAEAILTEAINEAPVETGTLRRSGTVTVGYVPDSGAVYAAASSRSMRDAFRDEEGKEQAVYISFNTPYARRQHEEIGYNHPLGGKAKYLEDPFNRNKSKVLKYVEAHVKRVLAKENGR